MHFYLLRGIDNAGDKVHRKLIAADDDKAWERARELFSEIKEKELLDCELVSLSRAEYIILPADQFYFVFGKRIEYNPTRQIVEIAETIDAYSDIAAASVVWTMHIEEPKLLRCRTVCQK